MSDGSLWAIARLVGAVGAVITSFTQQVQSPAAAAHSQRVWLPLPCDDRGACVRFAVGGAQRAPKARLRARGHCACHSAQSWPSQQSGAGGLCFRVAATIGIQHWCAAEAPGYRCVFVCVYACMYVCILVCIEQRAHQRQARGVCEHACIYVCMYVCSGSENYPPAGSRAATLAEW